MNVLVYDGPGVSQTSLSYTISTLKQLLQQNYVVQSISPKALKREPWAPSCALLVIPGGRDLPYLTSLGPAMNTISKYVLSGGSYLGFCAGAYFASSRVEWEMGTPLEVQGDRPLKFFPGPSHGCVYPGFQYESENGARSISIVSPAGTRQHGLYYNGGGQFIMSDKMKGVTPLAYYVDDGQSGMVAGVSCEVGKGKAVLWHVHLEFPTNSDFALAAGSRSSTQLSPEDLLKSEQDRRALLRETLQFLGLSVSANNPRDAPQPPSKPLPQFLCGSSEQVSAIAKALRQLHEKDSDLIEDANDTFQLHDPAAGDELPDISLNADFPDIRHIIAFPNAIPSASLTSHFSLQSYFEHLENAQRRYSSPTTPPLQAPIGSVLLYGEAVTSTQTLLQSNPKTLEVLPVPILSLATYQLNGRGRGSNVWASPLGCLQWSLLLRPPPHFPNNKLVFIQYLVGLAVVKACKDVTGGVSTGGADVVLKWPNDIYARTKGPKGEEILRKIGGILVNTVFMAGGVRVVVGCGLNVLNEPPILSLSQLLLKKGAAAERLTMEGMAATIMAIFGQMWDQFVAASGSFESFVDLYLESWVHSDQLVTLETVTPPVKVRIVGITPDHGLLRTLPEGSRGTTSHDFIDLQPDGNSFDMMAGLIKTKR
ncbi:hypothetical protein M408DRAFT_269108 [Serendipita vermifera MAFF 305830]|uniref:BPL/LPL catalytic domain-containing protein n=1 Tax=Serendipita vermifera MAFF 305830 TaxID=933852 RepID=A0A0C3AUI7_SERVB|nr:hypothetical protein M408DRAFT_269108 [Serendipita vermifera MAFF 305830]